MKRGSKFLIIALSTIAMAGTAVAQGDGGDAGDDGGDAGGGDAGGGDMGGGDMGGGDMGGDDGGGGGPPMILAKGKIGIAVSLQVSLLESAVAKPLSIQPDIFYGVMPKLQVGLAHSSHAINGFWGSLGGGICVSGTDGGCAKAYNGPIGLIANYVLVEGGVDLAADAGVLINSLDPMALGLKVGVKGRKMMGKMMIGFNPNISIGLTERDAGNKEQLNIPVDVHYMLSPKLGLGVQTGITGPLDGFGDFFAVPVSLGAVFMASDKLGVGGAFNLFRVAGFDGPGAADLRGITVFAMWHN